MIRCGQGEISSSPRMLWGTLRKFDKRAPPASQLHHFHRQSFVMTPWSMERMHIAGAYNAESRRKIKPTSPTLRKKRRQSVNAREKLGTRLTLAYALSVEDHSFFAIFFDVLLLFTTFSVLFAIFSAPFLVRSESSHAPPRCMYGTLSIGMSPFLTFTTEGETMNTTRLDK